MPNYVMNIIIISGSETSMSLFYRDITSDGIKHLSFGKTIPASCYHHIEKWGTKTEIGDNHEVIEDISTKYKIFCETAWDPPIPWARSASFKYKIKIKIIYIDDSNDRYGKVKCSPNKYQEKWKMFNEEIDETDTVKTSGKYKEFVDKYWSDYM